ncbi:MAG: flippase-like domain-containing protein [Hadesarchaea archaeon]|nr:flippase-like domain-containing protein [Hadesarchaea archaeon]
MPEVKFSLKKIIPLFIIGIAIISIMIAYTGISDILNTLKMADKWYYSLAILAQVTAILVWLTKWKILTKALDIEVKTHHMFSVLLSGIFVNTVVPSARVGGVPLRAYMFSRIGEIPSDQSFASVAADRALDGIPLIGIMLTALIMVLLTWSLPLYVIILLTLTTGIIAFVAITFLYVCLSPGPAKRFVGWLIKRLRRIIERFRPIEYVEEKAEEFMKGFSYGAQKILKQKKYVAPALTLSTIYWFLSIARMYIIFHSLNYTVSFGAIGIAITVGLILHAAPIPGGLGLVEGVYVLIFSAAGVPPQVSLAATLLDRSISFWFTGLISGIGASWSGHQIIKK